MRFRLDTSYERHGHVVIAGSPLRLFRLGAAGVDVIERLEAGDEVPRSRLTDRLLDAGAVHPVIERHAADPDRVTVVTPTRDETETVPPAAHARRTIVVDDGSEPPVPGATIRLDESGGPAVARNAGLDLVDTELVAFVDSDVELAPDWLDGLLGHFDDPSVALVAPRVRSTPANGRLARYERDRSPLDLGHEPARIRAGTRVSYVPAAALVCRTEAVRSIGGFDADLRFGEDVDLVWRLDRAGWRCRYEPSVEVSHRPRRTWRAWAEQRVGYGSSAAPLARRHPGALAPAAMSSWSAGAWALGAAGHPIAGAVVGAGSAAALTRVLDDVPPRVAFRLAALGTAHAGRTLASAVRRAWWPLVAVASVRSRTARRIGVVSLLAAGSPVRAVDDLAYGIGVWRGVWRERRIDALVPRFSSWPGRRDAG